MKVAIVCSNRFSLKKDTKKGTEIIAQMFINTLAEHKDISVTAFTSGDSDLQVPIESIAYLPSDAQSSIKQAGTFKYIVFELELISKAFSEQDKFDLYHIHIGDGDLALPFSPFVKKPILITLYHPTDGVFAKEYSHLYSRSKNIFFVSPTDIQRKRVPDLPYLATIYHGISPDRNFKFDKKGGNTIMWAGRAVPEKGMDIALEIAKKHDKQIKLFGILKKEHEHWFRETVLKKIDNMKNAILILDRDRLSLAEEFQTSKLFLFPLKWEEPFGLVLIESMACGTPVVAFARGSLPEIIKDGETGFLINPSDDDIRGNWIIKKTGIDGLREAVERIYSMKENDYLKMRKNCRDRVEKYFTIEHMVNSYIKVYEKILNQ